MNISIEKLKEMEELRDRCSDFIRNTSTPIKKQHTDDIKEYLDRFIKFPALTSVVSVIFTSSELVQSPKMAVIGMIFILTSFVIALNIFRVGIQKGKLFMQQIKEVEGPMVEFGMRLAFFSRDYTSRVKEKELLQAFTDLENSYEHYHVKIDSDDGNSMYGYIDLSFYMLLMGVVLSVLSFFNFC